MLKNYFITITRNLLRHKGYTSLNIFGLTIGIAAFLFIWLWTQDELSFDQFHRDKDKIYLVQDNQASNGKTYTFQAVPGLLAEAIRTEIPEVEYATTVNWESEYLINRDTMTFFERGFFAEPDFFNVFDVTILHASSEKPILDKYSIAISRKTALKYFGNTDVVGKALKARNRHDLTVSTVFEDIPANSGLQFDILLPYELYLESNPWLREWVNNGVKCYVKLHNASQKDAVNEKIKNLARQKHPDARAEFWLQELTRIRLYSNYENGQEAGGRIEYIHIFYAVGFSILLIACINFINLTTARSANRAKEVAMRKSVGALRSTLINQFLLESLLTTFLATFLATLVVQLLLPFFNNFTHKQITNIFQDPTFLIVLGGIALVTGIASGIYPAFLLSSVSPIKALKGQVLGLSGKSILRKTLVIVQLSFAAILITSSLILSDQINFIKSKNLGISKEDIIFFSTPQRAFEKAEAYKYSLGENAAILASTLSSQIPLEVGSSSELQTWPGKSDDGTMLLQTIYTDRDFPTTFSLDFVEGRNFAGEFSDTLSIIINEEAATRMTLTPPYSGQKIKLGREYEIIGVVKNFHTASLHSAMEPVGLLSHPTWGSTFVKYQSNDKAKVIKHIEKVYKEYEAVYPFNYTFLSDWYDQQYGNEKITSGLALLFTLLTIIISCLGLLGLSSFTAEKRIKELGIRKVLGGSVSELVRMLCQDYIKLSVTGTIIGCCIAFYVMKSFLGNYAFRTEITWQPFSITAVTLLLITLVTVSYQSIKATLVSPASSLRSE